MHEPLLERLPDPERALVLRAGELAAKRGERAYLVGGSVRDLFLGRAHTDLDVVVAGDGMALAQALARDAGGALIRYHAFQTARVDAPGGIRIDVATARREEYPRPGQLPQVVAGELEDDLERRDFTINAMALALSGPEAGRLIDPLDGAADLEAGRIRVMHSRSFQDDPTRILRALRFAMRFGYLLEAQTHEWLAVATGGGYLDRVSGDRLRRELAAMFDESPVEGPLRLQQEGVLAAVHAALCADAAALRRLRELGARYTEASVLHGAGADAGAEVAWSSVLACCAAGLPGQERWGLVRRLRLSRAERAPLIGSGAPWRKAVASLSAAAVEPPRSAVAAALRDIPPGALLAAAAAEEAGSAPARWARAHLEELRWIEPALTGKELRGMGVEEGPEIGALLEELRAARLDGAVGDEAGERRLVARHLDETHP